MFGFFAHSKPRKWLAGNIEDHMRLETGADTVEFICNSNGFDSTGYAGDVYRVTLKEDDSKEFYALRNEVDILDALAPRIDKYAFLRAQRQKEYLTRSTEQK